MFGNYPATKKEDTSLHLHFTSNSLSYGVYDSRQNLYTHFFAHRNLDNQLEWDSAFSNDPFLRLNYAECKASFTNNLFSIIPRELYVESENLTYLNFNVKDPDLYYTMVKPVENLEAEVVFCVDRDYKIILNKYYPDSLIYHSSIPLLQGLLNHSSEKDGDRLYIYTWNNRDMEIVGLRKGKLVLYNHFFLSSKEEFLYYPLYVCDRLGLERNRLEVYLGGNQNPSSKEAELLKPYFKKFNYLGLPTGYKYVNATTFQLNIGLIQSLAYLNLCG